MDAISDCGRFGLTIIGFIGSVFSPYYLKSGRAHPQNHISMNVALYGPRGARWCMTERPAHALSATGDTLGIGASSMRWTGSALEIAIDERACPLPRRVRGVVRVHADMLAGQAFALDPAGRHIWQPIAPRARVEVVLDRPGLNWSGQGYLDHNRGDESLEAGFRDWQWSRAHLGREAAVLYEGVRRDGSTFAAALRFDPTGQAHEEELPRSAPLPRSKWLMRRTTRADDGRATVIKTWEDSPFYARSALRSRLFGADVPAIHESLNLDLFASPVVQWMLPYRMPRAR